MTVWASVNWDGSLRGGKGVIAAENDPLNEGEYRVKFNRNVRDCAYSATPYDPSGDFAPGGISVSDLRYLPQSPASTLGVQVRNPAGNRQDQTFHLIVYC